MRKSVSLCLMGAALMMVTVSSHAIRFRLQNSGTSAAVVSTVKATAPVVDTGLVAQAAISPQPQIQSSSLSTFSSTFSGISGGTVTGYILAYIAPVPPEVPQQVSEPGGLALLVMALGTGLMWRRCRPQ